MDISKKLILGAIAILVGVILLNVLADMMNTNINLSEIRNSSLNVAACKTVKSTANPALVCNVPEAYNTTAYPARQWKKDNSECNLALLTAVNTSGTTLIIDTDINMSIYGSVALTNTSNLVNSTFGNNLTILTYTYCSDNYISDWGGDIMQISLGLIAVLVLGMGVVLLFQIYKESGIAG